MAGHNGRCLANLYLADKATGPEFTPEDEEVIGVLAVQAAVALVNATQYDRALHSRANLETLINISPVGVVVFDARTGQLVTYNREAERIIGDTGIPNGTWEDTLKLLLPPSSVLCIQVSKDEMHVTVSISLDAQPFQAGALGETLIRSTSSWLSETDREGGENKLAIAICQGIVNAHGGRLWIQPGQSDQGLTQGFSIPAPNSSSLTVGGQGPCAGWRPVPDSSFT